MTDLDITVLERGTTVRLEIVGALDASTVPDFVATVEPLTAEAEVMTIDCAALDFCDSSGLGGFVAMRNALGPDATFTLDNPTPSLQQILRITALTHLLATP